MSAKTIEQTYQKKTQLEHILLRPDTYIGSAEPVTQTLWVVDAEGKLVNREVTFVPGLYKIFDEILVNAADNKQRDSSMNKLEVTIAGDTITVWNNGTSIPVVLHGEHDVYVPELIFGHLLTSSNFDDDEKKVTGGRNGYGAKLTNIFSSKFVVETNDGTRGLKFRQEYTNNMSDRNEAKVTKATSKKDYTSITFVPDFPKFKMSHLDDDTVALLKKRVYDLAGVTDKSLKVFLNGAHVPVNSFKDYVAMYMPDTVYERCGERWEVAVGVSDGQFRQVSFVNSICTLKGGQHVQYVVDKVTEFIAEKASKKSKQAKGAEIKPFQVKNHLAVFVNCLVENPAFDSQTKETLTTRPKAFGSLPDISETFLKRIGKCGLVERVAAWSKFKESTELTKSSGTKKKTIKGIPKLDDATLAGSDKSWQCTLILTEGDSAKTLAISGLAIVGRERFGVFPLRGKLLNVRDCGQAKMMANAEIQALVEILGLKFNVTYNADNIKTLRYGAVMIMSDQDQDGSHIKGLVINFIHAYWPSLLRVPGFLCEFITPIVKCSAGPSRTLSFYTLPEYVAWQSLPENAKGWTVKYYKGLGTSSANEAKEYFRQIGKHRIPFAYEGSSSDDAIQLAFDKTRADDRKTWLLSIEDGTCVDYNVTEMPYTEFVNKELSLFSLADNVRSIPSVVDGLKPSQRKILYSCFKRNLVSEIKVAQLTGYVSEQTMYHHGEASLSQTIVGLAQDFVGSNNLNVLFPSGQFGSRLMGGGDAASPRYIFTKLSSVARLIYKQQDDALLTYLSDDGVPIEPKTYVPIIPMVLVNGASGIGTGWSTSIPMYNPLDLIHVLRKKLCEDEEGIEPIMPWFKGFHGTITAKDESHFVTSGVAAVSGDVVTITELPIGTWTQTYKAFLEDILETKNSASPAFTIKSYVDKSTDVSVFFEVHVSAACVPMLKDVMKVLRLETAFTTTNMHCFDASGKIQKYASPMEVVNQFYGLRLDMYASRHQHLIAVLEDELERLENKKRFIQMVIDGSLALTLPLLETLQSLRIHSFKQFDKDDEFDYLLSIPLKSLTRERVDKLIADTDTKKAQLEDLKHKTPKQLWMEDLLELEAALTSSSLSVVSSSKKRERADGNSSTSRKSVKLCI